ncbi:hypothetical protein Sfum_2835 [Syntrophobacter fumaroxidans MPOB]|uniref:Uncharacterized protein n=1 Tax=Syntrophobacter fumaroxidans (strain DSM 10017 / MPOB) TaxID=335543 RepID=A0LM61_SYNFM|nr:hypothetical protein Sfum_2835 [Syntrophobacter fumaroxidans MPOB]
MQARCNILVTPCVHERNDPVADRGVVSRVGGPGFPGKFHVSVVAYHGRSLRMSAGKVKGHPPATAGIRVDVRQVRNLLQPLGTKKGGHDPGACAQSAKSCGRASSELIFDVERR